MSESVAVRLGSARDWSSDDADAQIADLLAALIVDLVKGDPLPRPQEAEHPAVQRSLVDRKLGFTVVRDEDAGPGDRVVSLYGCLRHLAPSWVAKPLLEPLDGPVR